MNGVKLLTYRAENENPNELINQLKSENIKVETRMDVIDRDSEQKALANL